MYCLDTNIIVDILRGNETLRKKVQSISLSGEISITPITLCELFRGAFNHINAQKKVEELQMFVSSLSLLEFNGAACRKFGETYRNLKKSGTLTSEFDLMIASIVKAHDLILITRDKKDFQHTGVKLEIW